MTLTTKNFKLSSGTLDLTVQFNKRLVCCFVYIKFNTTEKSLLYNLLTKYIHEKVLFKGANAVNEIYNAVASDSGIMFSCSEKKIISNIVNIYSYLAKTKLTTKEVQNLFSSVANFNKLHKDIGSFKVVITGKTRNILKAALNSNDKKIEKLIIGLNNVEAKDIDSISVKSSEEPLEISYDASDKEKFDLALILEDTPFKFSGNKFVPLDKHTLCETCTKFKFDYGLSKVKAFFNSCGSPGVPAANDTGAKKFNEKCKYILECLNILTFMISDLHGFKYKINDIKELSTCGLQMDSKNKMRQLIKEIEKHAPK